MPLARVRTSSITATAACSTSPFATPSTCARLESQARSGSVGDSYDNALAETVIGLFETEVILRFDPCRNAEEVEFCVLEWVAWYNGRRLHTSLGHTSPIEFETTYHHDQATPASGAGLT